MADVPSAGAGNVWDAVHGKPLGVPLIKLDLGQYIYASLGREYVKKQRLAVRKP